MEQAVKNTTPNSTDDPKAFYDAQGITRHMLLIRNSQLTVLKDLAKEFRIKQGEVVEVLVDNMDREALRAAFEAKRGDAGVTRNSLVKQLKDMTPEQLAELERLMGTMKK